MQGANLAQHAVDAVTDAQEIGFRLEVDVGCLAFDGVGQYGVNQADNRLAVFVIGSGKALPVDFAGFNLMKNAVNRKLVAVILVNGAVDFRFASDQRINFDMFWQQGAQAVEADNVVDVGNCQRQALVGDIEIER